MITENAFGDVAQLYQAIRPFLDGLFWNDVRNADTCTWLVAGCLRSQPCSLPDWVSGRPSKAQYAQSRERQGRRFLANPHIDPISVYGPLVTAALRDWGEHRLVLALDTSMLFNQFCLIRLAVVFRGRAAPLCQEVIQRGSAQVSTEHLLPLLARVKGMIDFLGIKDVRLLADRGFCDVVLMNWLRVCNWQFRIRIKSNLILADPQGQRPGPCWGSALAKKRLCQLNEIKLSPKETRCFHQVAITGQHVGSVHVALGRPTQGALTQNRWASETRNVQTRWRRLNPAGRWFFARPHKICQAVRPAYSPELQPVERL